MQIIPAIDIIEGQCVRLLNGKYNKISKYGVSPVDIAKMYFDKGAKLIHIVDLDGARLGSPKNLRTIEKICSSVNIKCEVGGGIRDIESAKKLIDIGVFRIILGTIAIRNIRIVDQLLNLYGTDKIVVGIDMKEKRVAIEGWEETSNCTGIKLINEIRNLGIKTFIATDISKDGTLKGPNFNMIKDLCNKFNETNIIASGGVGSLKDIEKFASISSKYKNLKGIIVGKALYENKVSLAETIATLNNKAMHRI